MCGRDPPASFFYNQERLFLIFVGFFSGGRQGAGGGAMYLFSCNIQDFLAETTIIGGISKTHNAGRGRRRKACAG